MCALVGVAAIATSGCASSAARDAPAAPPSSPAAFSTAVNLRSGDLPGAEVGAPATIGRHPNAAFAACDGGVNPSLVVYEARSVLLMTGHESELLRSRVTTWPSERLARRNLTALAAKRGARCELHYGGSSVARVTIELPGGARAVGLRAAVPGQRAPEVAYHDIVGFVSGPAEVVLTAAGFGRPVPAQTERHLLGVLYRRATEARGT